MNILIAGGTGFLGKTLETYFSKHGHSILILTRKPVRKNHILWNGKELGAWAKTLNKVDVLINLTGKSVDCRYNEKNKAEILASRIDSTHILQQAISKIENPPKLWINASSATIYVHATTKLMTEDNGVIGDDFSMNVCKKWEETFFKIPSLTTRKVALRTSIVLGKNGGALPKMKTITYLGLGGHQGSGKQKVSWIHELDFCRAVEFIIDNQKIESSINVTAPSPTDNSILMKSIRKACGIPFGLSQPAALLEFGAMLLGTETELLLKSRNVFPQKLLENGFSFKYENIDSAMDELFKTPA